MAVHDPYCDCDTYGCVMRRKGLQVSPSAMPNRRNHVPPRRVEPPAFNREIVTDKRPDGSEMPLLRADGTPVRRKRFADNRAKYESERRALRAGLI